MQSECKFATSQSLVVANIKRPIELQTFCNVPFWGRKVKFG